MYYQKSSLFAVAVYVGSLGVVHSFTIKLPTDTFQRTLRTTTQLHVASLDNNSNSEKNDALLKSNKDNSNNNNKNNVKMMSIAIPFLPYPEPLVECTLPGNYGFDPLGFSKNMDDILQYREAEIRHSRLAMLAVIGWPLSELWDREIATLLGLPSALITQDGSDRVPSVLNGGLEKISPIYWGFCLGLTIAIEQYAIIKSREGNPNYFPGNIGFDPLNLYPKNTNNQMNMQLAEIKHGRLAMVAIVGFAIQEYSTSLSVIKETPFFFQPLF